MQRPKKITAETRISRGRPPFDTLAPGAKVHVTKMPQRCHKEEKMLEIDRDKAYLEGKGLNWRLELVQIAVPHVLGEWHLFPEPSSIN